MKLDVLFASVKVDKYDICSIYLRPDSFVVKTKGTMQDTGSNSVVAASKVQHVLFNLNNSNLFVSHILMI